MADIEGMVNSMGLTFFCNSMVEELYYMRENKSISEKLEKNCKKWIAEFASLNWPREEPSPEKIKTDLFNNNYNLRSFEQICEHYGKSARQMIDKLIDDLKSIISNKSIDKKYQTAYKLQSFFDVFGDIGFYATRDCIRC